MQIALLILWTLISWNSAMAVAAVTKTYTLDNGLRLIVREDHRAPVVVSQIWYKVGASKETLGHTGLSHALEHMMFQGTPTYPEDQFLKKIHQVGGTLNAATEYDWTQYYEVLSKDHLALSFKLEADRMQHLNLHEENFKKELQVVIEERRLRTDDVPAAVMQEQFLANALITSPYQNPVIGWRTDLDHMTVTDLSAWYDAWYAPNNAVLVVVGDVVPKEVYQLANQFFGPISQKPLPLLKPPITLPPISEKRIKVSLPAQVPLLIVGYQAPTYTNTADLPQIAALIMAGMILDGGSSGRLTKHLVRTSEIAAGVQVEYPYQMQHPHLFALIAAPTPGHTLLELETALKQELSELQSTLVSEEELIRVKMLWKVQHIYSADSMMSQAMNIGLWEVNNVSWEMTEQLNASITAVSAEDIQAVARQYFIPNRLSVGELVTENPL